MSLLLIGVLVGIVGTASWVRMGEERRRMLQRSQLRDDERHQLRRQHPDELDN